MIVIITLIIVTTHIIIIIIIIKSRCGDSDLTLGLTGSSVGSLATRESAPQTPLLLKSFSSFPPSLIFHLFFLSLFSSISLSLLS